MVLNNVTIPENDAAVSISISEGKITQVAPSIADDREQLTFVDAIAFPGLINSHDHLDFNLFPQFGNKIYDSYTEWGKHIHKAYADEIASVLKIPITLREHWGVYKNLLCGVTTVVNHGEKTTITDPLITIFENCQNIHSVQFEKNWKKRLNHPLKISQPVVIHTGEGTNAEAHTEIDELIKWNLFKRKLIGIHGVAMDAQQAKHFKALVWCPESNYFLLNKTATIDQLKTKTRILFGTDSTLTGYWDIWYHIRLARKTKMLTDHELYHSLTSLPAQTWKLNTGSITAGLDADIVIAKANRKPGLQAFYNVTPDDILLVMHKGEILLFDESLYHQLTGMLTQNYSKVFTGTHFKYVQGNIHELIAEIKRYKPDADFPVPYPVQPAA
ncbi:Amidohydrolase family protein [Mucilaginibacter gossypiicola]|uniref:Amidohydrolase family protein n=1 Tax=Mucilaginibacter gossypiicola TaxID=551995 RepID=A0A1H8G9K4_9SPHI|nr:amidohydrolase family protein [Mucilaginibacter gossypiicola]SEN40434.1 Amidohydrolase family protein [Mucilaginibacter gossypiicola]